MRLLLVLAAVLVLAGTLLEVFEVLLLPRRVQRRLRFVRVYFRALWRLWRALAGIVPARRRADVLAAFGPLSMIGLLATWTFGFVTAFGVLQWALHAGAPDVARAPSLLNQLYFSGVTFFTLGYGDVTAATRVGKVVAVVEAGMGFGFIAIVIGYLPVLYQLFSQREARVIRLDGRAGSPPTALALLERHAGAQGMPALGALFIEWEQAAGELLESHLSYPMLAYYRSQHDNESWLAALTAIADAAALVMAGLERPGVRAGSAEDDVPRFQARMAFAAARLTIVQMARVLADVRPGAPPPPPAVERLPPAAFAELRTRLAAVGLRPRDPAAAEQALRHARAGYEPHLAALAARLALPLPPWVRPRDVEDNWESDAGGASALYEASEAQEVAPTAQAHAVERDDGVRAGG